MLSLFNPVALKQIWDNYDAEFCSNMRQVRYFGFYLYSKLDPILLFSRQYFDSTNKELLRNLTMVGVSIEDIDGLFTNQEQVNRLNSINQNSLSFLIKKNIISVSLPITILSNTGNPIRVMGSLNYILSYFNTQKNIDMFNSVNLDVFKALIDKKIIESSYDVGELLNNTGFITNATNHSSLTKTILNNDSLIEALGTKGIIGLISHPKYTESSSYLLRNCQLALVLRQKRVITNFTTDDLLDKNRIQTQAVRFFSENTRNNQSVPPGLSSDLLKKSSDVVSGPMPKLTDISLVAFVKNNMPESSIF